MKLTKDICELIGSIIGDGNIYDKKPYYVEITGDSKLDEKYHTHLCNICIKQLMYSPKIKFRDGAIRTRINKKEFVWWLKELGIPVGAGKFCTVMIPNQILRKQELLVPCIRGIFDTDGCVSLDFRKTYKKPYVRIILHMYNPNLLNQIQQCLEKLRVNSTLSTKKEFLYINGEFCVKIFLQKIGLSNTRHLFKFVKQYPNLLKYNIASVAQSGGAIVS